MLQTNLTKRVIDSGQQLLFLGIIVVRIVSALNPVINSEKCIAYGSVTKAKHFLLLYLLIRSAETASKAM